MNRIIRDSSKEYLITENNIREVEERFEIRFPEVLRQFYLEHSGAKIKYCKLNVNDEVLYVEGLYYIKDPILELEQVIQWDRDDGCIPENMVILAYDEGRERYYWDSNDESVYFFDSADLDNPIFICKTIREFFDLLINAEECD